MLLNWPLKSGKIPFKKLLGDPKIQEIVTAAIDDDFVNSLEGGESRELSEEKTRKFSYTLFLGVIVNWFVSIRAVVNANGGDDEERKKNFDNGFRFKGRFAHSAQSKKKTFETMNQSQRE